MYEADSFSVRFASLSSPSCVLLHRAFFRNSAGILFASQIGCAFLPALYIFRFARIRAYITWFQVFADTFSGNPFFVAIARASFFALYISHFGDAAPGNFYDIAAELQFCGIAVAFLYIYLNLCSFEYI